MDSLCVICISVLEDNVEIVSTRCGHMFHKNCIMKWIKRSSSCPQCRKNTTADEIIRIYPTFSIRADDIRYYDKQLQDLQSLILKLKCDVTTYKSQFSLKEKYHFMYLLKKTVDNLTDFIELESIRNF